MKEFFVRKKMIGVLILWLALAGCVTKASAPTNFYMIAPLIPAVQEPSGAMEKGQTVIAIMNVRIPSYLDRNQIVTRLNETEYGLAEFDQWAEPIDDNLTRAIAQNLSRLLAADAADVFPAAREVPHNYSIGVEVIRLDGKLGDQVTLTARWAIFGEDQDDLIVLRKFEHQEKTEDDTYKGLVIAQSRTVEKLSQDIAAAIKEILKKT